MSGLVRVHAQRVLAAHNLIVPTLQRGTQLRSGAQWIAAHTLFDRLYFYGDDLPIHVSFGPQHDRQIVWMKPAASGRLVPRVIVQETF